MEQEKEVPLTQEELDEKKAELNKKKDEDEEVVALDEEKKTETAEEEIPTTKTVKETVWDWEVINTTKPVWMRPAKEVSDEEYSSKPNHQQKKKRGKKRKRKKKVAKKKEHEEKKTKGENWENKFDLLFLRKNKAFYHSLTHDTNDPLHWSHFNAEGEVNFKSVLYIPAAPPQNMWDPAYDLVINLFFFPFLFEFQILCAASRFQK